MSSELNIFYIEVFMLDDPNKSTPFSAYAYLGDKYVECAILLKGPTGRI